MGTKIAEKKDVQPGSGIAVESPDGKSVALFNVGGTICALDGTCPHAGGPLGEGSLEDDIVTCPWHGWSFNVKTGDCQNNPDAAATCLKVSVRGEEIILE